MANRRTLNEQTHGSSRKGALSVSSVLSNSSSNTNLAPFEGLAPDEVSFIEAIISRVNPAVTTFVPVFKAYQDEFEECGRSASDDQFYYNLLLKLGMIRAENWHEKWRIVKEHFGYSSSSFVGSTIRQGGKYQPKDDEDDAFTLHSQAGSATNNTSPGYKALVTPKQPKATRTNYLDSQTESTQPSSSNTRGLSSILRESGHRRSSSATTKYEENAIEIDRPTHVKSKQAGVRSTAPRLSSTSSKPVSTRDDAETWRIIEMERDADLFRRESLMARCLDVWIKGLKWVEATSTQLDNARTEFLLRSILNIWRVKAEAAMKETKKASVMHRLRVLNSALFTWRRRAWEKRRQRWAKDMRGLMTVMQSKVQQRLLQQYLLYWRQAQTIRSTGRQYDAGLLRRSLITWCSRLRRLSDLSRDADKLKEINNAIVIEKALATWKRQTHFRIVTNLLRKRQSERIQRQYLQFWQQKTQIYSVAGGFSDARILRETLRKWVRRRARLQYMERRAIAHQNKPLVRAVVHIWLTKSRLQKCLIIQNHRVLSKALDAWIARLQQHRDMQQQALVFRHQHDSRLLGDYTRKWALELASQMRLERRARRYYESTQKAMTLIRWRTKMKQNARAGKNAKLARRIFLERMVWQRWREAFERKQTERKLAMFVNRRLGAIIKRWSSKAKAMRNLKRKGEVVLLTQQSRILREALRAWTLRVVFLKDREYSILQARKEKLLHHFFIKWRRSLDQHRENTSLMQSFQDVRREDLIRRVLGQWRHATRRQRSLLVREEEFKKAILLQALEKWRDKFLEISLQPIESDVLMLSQTNLLFKMFRLWEARTTSVPAIRFRAYYLRAHAWAKWKAAMPGAMKRKEAREHDQRKLVGRAFARWKEKYRSKIALKAVARARYLRLPPAPPKPSTSRLSIGIPKNPPRSYRSASPEREPVSRRVSAVFPPRAESNRAPSPTSTKGSLTGLDLPKRRPLFGAPSSIGGSRSSLDERVRSSLPWDGLGGTRSRARAAFSAGISRPSGAYQGGRLDSDSD